MIMDIYKKKYDEALEKARVWKEKSGMPADKQSILDGIFPELAESEDERIRKELIEHVKDQQSSFISAPDCRDKYEEEENDKYNSWLAWLEKQSEQNPIINVPPREIILAIWDLGNEWKELTNGSISTEYGTQLDYIQKHWQESEYYLREKQGEQKSTDKVEPKFKVGDWVISTLPGIKYPHLITDIQDGYYIFGEDDDHAHIASNDDVFKLWTIADAKNGDVLDANGAPFIYKKHSKDYVYFYCGVNLAGNFIEANGIDTWDSNNIVYPATKEQRDLLFQKMKEAGYEWDAEKKELLSKPIKYNSNPPSIDKKSDWSEEDEEYNGEDYGIDSLYHAQRILENTLGNVDGYQTDDGILDHKAAITAVKKLYKQKHSLSEEDEHRIKLLEALCEDKLCESVPNSTMYEEMKITIDWLKSLRPQPKQKWTKEDEKMFISLKTLLNDASCYSCTEGVDKILAWLKQKIGE